MSDFGPNHHRQASHAWEQMAESGWLAPEEQCGVYIAGESSADKLLEFYTQHQAPAEGNSVRVFAYNIATEKAFTVQHRGGDSFIYRDPDGVIAALDPIERQPLKMLAEANARGQTRVKMTGIFEARRGESHVDRLYAAREESANAPKRSAA